MADKPMKPEGEAEEVEAVVDPEFDEKGTPFAIPVDILDEETEEKQPMPMPAAKPEVDPVEARKRRRAQLLAELAELDAAEKAMGGPDDEEEEEMVEEEAPPRPEAVPDPEALRMRRLTNMGFKSAEIATLGKDPILCQIERKVLTDGNVCDWCKGGCASEKGLPGLLDVEAMAEHSYKGIVLNSGYAPADDVFIVDLQRKSDGKAIEIIYGGDGEDLGWHMLDQKLVGEKVDPLAGQRVISRNDAESIATKELPGVALGATAATFEGYDAWVVEVEGFDSKSYDAYVALDGSFLGYDEYDMAELDDEATGKKELPEEDVEVKRQFSTSQREDAADAGHALPDGSFPIKNEQDLKNAIQAFGRAKNPDVAKAHIMKRAMQLGLEKLIPDKWTSKSSEKSDEDDGALIKELMEFEMLATEIDTKDPDA